jgi:DNA repair protein RadC
MKITDIPEIERPREKLLSRGSENLKLEELYAILIRSGRKGLNALEIGASLTKKFSLPSLQKITFEELSSIEGIDISKACTLLAAIELGKRLCAGKDTQIRINTPEDSLPLLSEIKLQKKEHFVVIYLNARQEVIHKEVVSVGTLNASLVHPREVFEPALKHLASVILLAHNHPSGDEEPSDADISITKRLSDVGKLMGIEVMDHIIITGARYYSFREHNMI